MLLRIASARAGDAGGFRAAAFGRGGGDHRVADVAQRAVDRVNKQMHRRRLARAGHHETLAVGGEQVVGGFGDPLRPDLAGGSRRPAGYAVSRSLERRAIGTDASADLLRERRGHRADLAGLAAQAVVRLAAGDGVAVFHHVQPVHRVARLSDPAAVGEIAGGFDAALFQIEEIAVQREDHFRLVEARRQLQAVAERGAARLDLVEGRSGSYRHQSRFGNCLVNSARRRSRVGECVSSTRIAVPAPPVFEHLGAGVTFMNDLNLQIVDRLCPRAETRANGRDRTIPAASIGRTGRSRRCSAGCRPLPSSLIGRPSTVEAISGMAPRRRGMRGRVEHGLAGDDPLDRLGVRHQVRLGTAATAQTETRERHRRAHQLEKITAGKRVALHLGRAGGKFPSPASRETPACRSTRRGCASICGRSDWAAPVGVGKRAS